MPMALIRFQKLVVKLSAKCTPAYLLFAPSNCYQFSLVLDLYPNSANKVLLFARSYLLTSRLLNNDELAVSKSSCLLLD